MTNGLRFRPPPVAVTPELRWVLEQAFAEVPGKPSDEVDAGQALELARRLGLDARIGGRLRGGTWRDELRRASAQAAASALQAREAAEVVAQAAATAAIPCCFLKGVALDALGVARAGTRPISDVDVLVEPADTEPLAAALRERGFVSEGEEYPHQLRPLVHPHFGSVEVHRHLPGIRVPGGAGFATLGGVARHGLLVPWDGIPGAALLPARPLLAAHLLAHALAQHGFRPEAYPPMRVLGDLIDLRVGAEGDPLLDRVLPLLAGSVPESETQASVAACGRLRRGGVEDLSGAGAADLLLRHLLAGGLDEGYRARLPLQDLRHPLADRGRTRAWLRAARTALELSPGQIDAIYGRPRYLWGYAARRALRPFDLVWRAGRAFLGSKSQQPT